jgi:peptidoglycan hydrolase-like protein with peptidoglycan-binding domain
MQRIRETLISSLMGLVLTTSGVALAGEKAPPADSKRTAAESTRFEPHIQGHEASLSTSASVTVTSVSRERVMIMQRELAERGFYDGKIDGIAGPETRSALREFQNRNGLAATGELNASTADALGMNGDRQPVAGTDTGAVVQPPARVVPHAQPALEDGSANVQLSTLSPEQAKEMQERLQLLGYYRGEIDGRPGPATRAALQQYFQAQADLAERGVISNSAISMFGTEVQEVPAK